MPRDAVAAVGVRAAEQLGMDRAPHQRRTAALDSTPAGVPVDRRAPGRTAATTTAAPAARTHAEVHGGATLGTGGPGRRSHRCGFVARADSVVDGGAPDA